MKYLLIILFTIFYSCENENSGDWLIPQDEVLDGGPGKDGIPSVDHPFFDNVENITFLDDDDLVIGIFKNGEAKAYPHPILDWHEIVNDDLSDIQYAMTYCPLTGTGIAWDRNINGNVTSFGVSGKLYNTNLIPYDRATDSYWSQIRMDCVSGELMSERINVYPSVETSWATWKEAYPNSLVMNTNTGFNRDYNSYPYGDYRTNHNNLIFPISNTDNRLPAKERVLAIITDAVKKVYSIELFGNGRIIVDQINNNELIIIGSKVDNFIVAFENTGYENLTYLPDALPVIAQDNNGNQFTIDGQVLNNSIEIEELKMISGVMGYFFSFGTFYEVDIYE